MTRRPLDGLRVLVTRRPEQISELRRRLEDLGATVDARSPIRLESPPDPGPVRQAVDGLAGYSWIVFTSANGVRFFAEALDTAGLAMGELRARIATVGPATARAIRDRGLRVSVQATVSRAEGLADALGEQDLLDRRVLVVRPVRTRPVLTERLEERGALVDSVAFYRNAAARDVREISADVVAGTYDVVVFSSPSTVTRLFEGAGSEHAELAAALGRGSVISIGPVTAAELERRRVGVDATSAEPSAEGIVEAVRGLPPG